MLNKTKAVLELNKITERLSRFCSHPLSKEWAQNLPLAESFNETETRLFETECALQLIEQYPLYPSGALPPMEQTVKKADKEARLNPEDLYYLLKLLNTVVEFQNFYQEELEIPLFSTLIAHLENRQDLRQGLMISVDESFHILDTASQALKSIRRELFKLQNKEKKIVEGMARRKSLETYLQEAVVVKRGDSYCLSVKREYAYRIPGVVQDTSSTGSTVFLEPQEAIQVRSERNLLERQEKEEIERILRSFSEWAYLERDLIKNNYEALGKYNFYLAKALLLKGMKGSIPKINNKGLIALKRGRHPLLEGDVVANDVYLGDTYKSLIITGPNTGGKTVLLKMVGLFALMLRLGLGLPVAEASEFSFFSNVFAQIGDQQDMEQSLSTFSAHMVQIKAMVDACDNSTLLLFDELGSGTDPAEGSSLAMAVLNYCKNQGSCTIATTHYGELKAFAYDTPGFKNASMTFDEKTLGPTYELVIGTPGASLGLVVARRYGLKEAIVREAEAYQQKGSLDVANLIEDLDRTRQSLKEEKALAEALKTKLIKEEVLFKEEQEAFRQKIDKIQAKEKAKAEKLLQEVQIESEAIIKELKEQEKNKPEVANKARKKIEALKKVHGGSQPIVTGKVLKSLEAGSQVFVLKVRKEGIVETADDHKKMAQVRVGLLTLNVPYKELQLVKEEQPKKGHSMPNRTYYERKSVATEIDLRGQRLEEAVYNLDKYLDDAYLTNVPFVRIIHGKGTGALQKGIWEYLKGHPHIKSFRYGESGEGGHGVTVAKF